MWWPCDKYNNLWQEIVSWVWVELGRSFHLRAVNDLWFLFFFAIIICQSGWLGVVCFGFGKWIAVYNKLQTVWMLLKKLKNWSMARKNEACDAHGKCLSHLNLYINRIHFHMHFISPSVVFNVIRIASHRISFYSTNQTKEKELQTMC